MTSYCPLQVTNGETKAEKLSDLPRNVSIKTRLGTQYVLAPCSLIWPKASTLSQVCRGMDLIDQIVFYSPLLTSMIGLFNSAPLGFEQPFVSPLPRSELHRGE